MGLGAVLAWGGYEAIWGEREGTIKTDDCRARIMVDEFPSRGTLFKTFTCSYRKTVSGKILDGYCESVYTTNGTCETVYVYQKKKNNGGCVKPNPYLGEDDHCHEVPQ